MQNVASLRIPSVLFVVRAKFHWHLLKWVAHAGRKTSKIAHQIFKKKSHFWICALSYRPQGTHRKSFTLVHNCISSAIQKHKKVALKFYNIVVIRCAQTIFARFFAPHLKVWQIIAQLWNASIRKFLYRWTSTIIGCCGIFTALHGMQKRFSDENSVCLSVWQTRELWLNGRRIRADFYAVDIRKII